jgi:hypothetical protein
MTMKLHSKKNSAVVRVPSARRLSSRRSRTFLAASLTAAVVISGWAAVAAEVHTSKDAPNIPQAVPSNAPAAKQAIQQKINTEAAMSTPAPFAEQRVQQGLEGDSATSAGGQRVVGIDNSGATGPFSSSQFTVSNSYQGPVGQQWLIAYAGAENGKPAIRVYATNADPSAAGFVDLLATADAPAPSAGEDGLRIAGVSGSALSFTDGEAFDLSTLKFVAK